MRRTHVEVPNEFGGQDCIPETSSYVHKPVAVSVPNQFGGTDYVYVDQAFGFDHVRAVTDFEGRTHVVSNWVYKPVGW